MNDNSQPSEVAPIDMDTTANPWESAAAASSPTPGKIIFRDFTIFCGSDKMKKAGPCVGKCYRSKMFLFFCLYTASAFDSFEFPSGSPQSTSVATATTTLSGKGMRSIFR